VQELQPDAERKKIIVSIIRHTCTDIKDFKTSETARMSSYTPHDQGGVVNASAYRAFTLTSAAKFLGDSSLLKIAEPNIILFWKARTPMVLPYAKTVCAIRGPFPHCFVMKALAKLSSQRRARILAR